MGVIGNSLRFIFRGLTMFSGWIFYFLWKGFKFSLIFVIFLIFIAFLIKGCIKTNSNGPKEVNNNNPKVVYFDPPRPYDPFYKHYLEDDE
jgi:hypothetical protein